MKQITLLLLCALTIAGSCKKKHVDTTPPDPLSQLPPYSEKGALTFGCLINGEVFKPWANLTPGYHPLGCTLEYEHNSGNYLFHLTAINYKAFQSISFFYTIDTNFIIPGVYPLDNYNTVGYYDVGKIGVLYGKQGSTDLVPYTTYPPYVTGEINIKYFNLQKRIVSGTFWFDAVDTINKTDTIHVTNGRFDLIYNR